MFKKKKPEVEFDLILANPPFSIGNEITEAVVKYTEFGEYVNLMPFSYYKKNSLGRHIDLTKSYKQPEYLDLRAAGFDADGAALICRLKKDPEKKMPLIVKPEFQDFFDINLKRPSILAGQGCTLKTNKLKNLDPELLVLHYGRHAIDCMSSISGALEFWEPESDHIKDYLDLMYYHCNSELLMTFSKHQLFYYIFPSKMACQNFKEWWKQGYERKLAFHIVSQGGCWTSNGEVSEAVPRIDWESISGTPLWKQGKYDEAVCEAMGLELVRNEAGEITGVRKVGLK